MPNTTMICTCGHADDEHDGNILACGQCDCDEFELRTDNKGDRLGDWDGE